MNSYHKQSFLYSVIIHLVLLSGIFFLQFTKQQPVQQYLEVGIGEGGPGGSPGDGSNQFGVVNAPQDQAPADVTDLEKKDAKVDISKSENLKSDDAVIADKKESRSGAGSSLPAKGSGKPGKGFGSGEGNGTGYDIDWGAQGQRKNL